MPSNTYVSIRRQHQDLHGKLEDEEFPSREYVQSRIEQLEEGELKAESLTEVVNVREAGPCQTAGHDRRIQVAVEVEGPV